MRDRARPLAPWWRRRDLTYVEGELKLAGQGVAQIARELGTPLFLYSAERVRQQLVRLLAALHQRGLRSRVLYALKANRFQPLVTHLRRSGRCGVDACSPREVRLARQMGFAGDEISYTATAIADHQLDAVLRTPGLMFNCDALSTIQRVAQRSPGRSIGLRIDPGVGLGYRGNPKLRYSGGRHSKLGIANEEVPRALDLARAVGLEVTGLHMHTGSGYLDPQLPAFEKNVERMAEWCDQIPGLERINLGGGLGVPLTVEDRPLDLDRWSGIIARHLGDRDLEIQVEPGDFLVKDSGVLVCRVTTVEHKRGVRYVGINAGFQLQPLPSIYGLPLEVVPCEVVVDPVGETTSLATVAGNINEAADLFAVDISLPEVAEGSFLALLNAGGYGSAMASDHCLQGGVTEMMLWP